MALDGIAIANIIYEMKDKLLGGRIDKIYQPNQDEIIVSVRSIGSNFKLLLSANSSHPRLHITKLAKENPMTPPMFCMVLRKYIAGGKIIAISQPNFERIIQIEIESMNELGDMAVKKLIIEIMGKHSNIILIDENRKILDSIKRISHDKSSIREVLPGKEYMSPPSQNKQNPLFLEKDSFFQVLKEKQTMKLQAVIYQSYTGISPIMASEICFRANIDSSCHPVELSVNEQEQLYTCFLMLMQNVQENTFSPEIIYQTDTGKLVDFSSLEMQLYCQYQKKKLSSISELLEEFYQEKDNAYHIAQKAHDMRKLIISNIERCIKKKEIQNKTLHDIADMELWRRKGELITANIYAVSKGQTILKTIDFYEQNQPEIEIALNPTKTPSENAQKYFNQYNKAKRTLVALEVQKKQNEEELDYLENVLVAIENATETADLTEIRTELAQQGFVKAKYLPKGKKQKPKKTIPHHFVSSQGYDIYVGKNNTQNDELTMKFAKSDDIWLHTKNIPGSHVIIKKQEEQKEIPDTTIFEAAHLAVNYSKAKNSSTVPVDYTYRKYIRKPNGAKPGFVIYDQNKTIYITLDEKLVHNLSHLS